MIIIRSDTVGQVDMRLVSRPTNTCIGVSNYHFCAVSHKGMLQTPIVRFFGTDSEIAVDCYERAIDYARTIEGELS